MSAPQFELVIEGIHGALTEIVRALGGSEKVGRLLWPEKNGSAGQYLNDCLNVARRERLNPEQVWLLFVWARQAGFHTAMRWFNESCGYAPSEPIEPEDERAKLQREFINSQKAMSVLLERMERLNAAPGTKVKR